MPRAGLGGDVGIWVTEEGFATNLNRSLQRQVNDLTTTIESVHEYSGTLNVTDFRYFNLRDNNSDGGDIFDAVGCSSTSTRRSRRSRPTASSSSASAWTIPDAAAGRA